MAVGDQKPVVMEFDKAAAGGVASLNSFGLIPTAQIASGTAGEGYVPTVVNGALQWLPQSGGGGSGNIVAQTYYATLTASGWTGSAAPYSQTVSIGATLTAGQGALIGAASTASIQQRYACRAAVISVSAVGTSTITVIADGVKPAVDIPAEIVIFAGDSDYYTKSVTDALLAGKADASAVGNIYFFSKSTRSSNAYIEFNCRDFRSASLLLVSQNGSTSSVYIVLMNGNEPPYAFIKLAGGDLALTSDRTSITNGHFKFYAKEWSVATLISNSQWY